MVPLNWIDERPSYERLTIQDGAVAAWEYIRMVFEE